MKSLFLGLVLLAAPTFATDQSLRIEFRESAPKDMFTLTNNGNCAIDATVVLDLSKSQGNLIFDTTSAGLGVEVFQPFEMVTGASNLDGLPTITDGDQVASLKIKDLKTGQAIAFTIDVDDQLTNSSLGQIRVANAEISGATIANSGGAQAAFGAEASAALVLGKCG